MLGETRQELLLAALIGDPDLGGQLTVTHDDDFVGAIVKNDQRDAFGARLDQIVELAGAHDRPGRGAGTTARTASDDGLPNGSGA